MDSRQLNALAEDTRLIAVKHQSSCNLADEAVILNLDSGVYYGLNPIGARVWELLQSETSVAAIRDALVEEYEVSAERCLSDLLQVLRELTEEGLVEVCGVGDP